MKTARLLLPIYSIVFFGFIGYSLLITVFTPSILENGLFMEGVDSSFHTIFLGGLIFAYPFGQFISSPILGAFSDRFGRKPILTLSLAVTTLCYFFVGLGVYLNSYALVLSALFVAGLGEGNVTISQVIVADKVERKHRGKYLGYIYLSASFAYIIGPLLGGRLMNYHPSVPFFCVSGFLVLTFFWILIFFQETLKEEKKHTLRVLEAVTNIKYIFLSSKFRSFFLVSFLLNLAIFGFFNAFPMYIESTFHLEPLRLAELISWLSLPIIIVNCGVIGYLLQRFKTTWITLVFALFFGISLIIIAIPQPLSWIWGNVFFVGFFLAIVLTASTALLSSVAEPHEQGRVMGNNQSIQFLSDALSGLVSGMLGSLLIQLSLIVYAVLCFFSVIALAMYARQWKKKGYLL